VNRTRVHRRAQPAADAHQNTLKPTFGRSASRLLRITAVLLVCGNTLPAQAQAINGQQAVIQLSDSDVQATTPTLYITNTRQSVFRLDSDVLKITSANPKMFEIVEVDGNTITIKALVKLGVTDMIITTTDGKQGIFDLRAVADNTPNLPRTVLINFNKPVVVRTTPSATTSTTVSSTLQGLLDARAARLATQQATAQAAAQAATVKPPATVSRPATTLRPVTPTGVPPVVVVPVATAPTTAVTVTTVSPPASPQSVAAPVVATPVLTAPAPAVLPTPTPMPVAGAAPAAAALPATSAAPTQTPWLAWTTQTMMTAGTTTIYYTLSNSGSKTVFLDSARLRADVDGTPVTVTVNRINSAPVLSPGQSDYGTITLPAFKGGVLTINWDMTDQTGTAYTYTRSINAQQSNAGR